MAHSLISDLTFEKPNSEAAYMKYFSDPILSRKSKVCRFLIKTYKIKSIIYRNLLQTAQVDPG